MIRIGLDKNWQCGGWHVYAHRYTPTGRIPFKITITEMPEVPEFQIAEPSCAISRTDGPVIVKAIIDGLSDAGLMPAMGATEAELRATLRHLNDMRALTFESIGPKEIE